MEQLRKIVDQLWYNKERLFLGGMVLVLSFYVYKAMTPEKAPAPITCRSPVPLDSSAEDGQITVPKVPEPPAPRVTMDWASLTKRNPFWYYSTPPELSDKNVRPEDAGIALMRIVTTKGKARAQLRTASSSKWYEEGDKFESFELLSINPSESSCDVFSERLARVITLKQAGR